MAVQKDFAVPTTMRTRLGGGRLLGLDGSMWLWRRVPLAPVVDAKSVEDRLDAFTPLLAAYEELAAMASYSVTRRNMARGSYRQTHLLMVNLARLYTPEQNHPIAGFLKEMFPNAEVKKRVLLLGVKITAKTGGGGGWRAAMESATETLISGGTPLSDFEADAKKVDAALARCGLSIPSNEEFRIANSWWNRGDFPDSVTLPHAEHLHVFSESSAVATIKDQPADCGSWPEQLPGHQAITLASMADLDFNFVAPTDIRANWATGLIDDRALAVSIRGNVEPANITRDELRRQRKRYMDDITERFNQGKMERSEQTEKINLLAEVENVYASQNGSPTIVDGSVLVAFDGQVEDMAQVAPGSAAVLQPMSFRQSQALTEMMLCSPFRANPNLHDIPSQTIACAGLQGLSVVGDRTGALLGFTERDNQPAYMDPQAAYNEDNPPLMTVVGQTGSGKTMVLLWLALQSARMNRPQVIVDPKALALDTRIPTPSGWTTMGEIKVGDQVFGRDGKPCTVTHKSRVFTPDETRLYEFVMDDGQVITADQNHQWAVASPKDRAALERGLGLKATELTYQAEIVEGLALTAGDADTMTTQALLSTLKDAGVSRWTSGFQLPPILKRNGVVSPSERKPFVWPAGVALKALAGHLHEEVSMGTSNLRVLTTDEMLSHGTKTGSGQTYWAIPVPKAVELPEASLPVDPYLLGAWLGDGTTKSGAICAGAADADEMQGLLEAAWQRPANRVDTPGQATNFFFPRDPGMCKRGHQDFVPTVKGSIRCRSCGTGKATGEQVNNSLGELLSGMELLGDKHIPAAYLRSSAAQRLALLQGLMDTDGTVHVKRGELRITLTNQRLAEHVLTLVRSLGIKAHWHDVKSVSVGRDSDGEAVRKEHGRAYTITFQTDLPVFRMERKRSIQPKPRFQAGFMYVKEIRQVASAEAQCIRVDSPDHTYMVGDYVVTHNTGSDHSGTVLAAGGQVASLDELTKADGVFDPIRFAKNAATGVELAVSMIASIDPWGRGASQYEADLYHALNYGISRGAVCTGQALEFARADKQASPEMVDPILKLSDNFPMFRACVGRDPSTKPLSLFDGVTLIKVGKVHLDLPDPGNIAQATLNQRVNLALVRMMVFGSAMGLEGRGGLIHLDEAWVFLGAGKAEIERLGRLARSQQLQVNLYTQRISDALNANLSGYISRGVILPIQETAEAKAALELFGLEATAERMGRITAKDKLGDGEGVALNWNSMRALRDPKTREVKRGAVGFYIDLAGRAVPVEVKLPPAFLELASTSPEDIKRMLAKAQQAA